MPVKTVIFSLTRPPLNCEQWAYQPCAGLSNDEFKTLSSPQVQWTCLPGRDRERENQARSHTKLDVIVTIIHSMNSRLEAFQKGLSEEKLEEKIEEVVNKKVAKALGETRERGKRKKEFNYCKCERKYQKSVWRTKS